MESLRELKEILKNTFKNKLFLKFNDFLTTIQSQSDIYLQLLCYLYQKCPFKNECINLVARLSSVEKKNNKSKEQNSSDSIFTFCQKSTNIKLNTPSYNSRFSPAHDFLKNLRKMVSSCSETCNSFEMSSSNLHDVLQKNIKTECKSLLSSESVSHRMTKEIDILINHDIKMNVIPYEDILETGIRTSEYISMQGYLLRPSISAENDFNKYWISLIDKDLYYYADETKEKFIKVHHLVGSFIRAVGQTFFKGVKYYTFSIISGSIIRNFNSLNREETKNWITKLKQNVGYKNFFDFYEIIESIAEGSFGQVKLGINLVTKEKVAVKVIIKPQIYTIQYESLLAEIEILKVCKHPNIVQYIDHFENSEYLFIVMEYHRNGNLKNYLKSRNFVISEEKIANIAFQIANVLKYLECYGIIHRDIKPENILIVNKNENNGAFKVKIMDFGFGKILGKKEKSIESYGTLSYAAPEILNRKPYNNSVDIWSFGILLYYMTSSACPFDSKNIFQIMKQICNESITFEKSIWEKRSSILKDLIKSCLDKNLLKRINCDEILNHNFIKSHVKINYNIY